MTDKELKRLSRKELLVLLIAQTKEVERLTALTEELQQELNRKQRQYSKIGSLAETVLKVNNVCEDAQKAADQYLNEIMRLKKKAQEEHDKILGEAGREAERMLVETKKLCEQKLSKTNRVIQWIDKQVNEYFKEYPGVRKFIEGKLR